MPTLPSLERIEVLLRTIVRPAVTLILVVVASVMVAKGLPVQEWYRDLVLAVVFFWFGSRQGNQR